MEQISSSVKPAIIRLILVNLVPVIGVIFFEWELFEIGITYILETCAIYLVFEIDYYFVDSKTRFPFAMALIQFVFTGMTFSAMMYASAMIIYVIVTPQVGEYNDFIKQFSNKLDRMYLVFPAVSMLLIEITAYYIRKRKDSTHQSKSTWRMIRRILYSHLYLVVSLIILSVFPQNLFVLIPFFIGLKIVLEYSTEDKRNYEAIGNRLLKTAIVQWFTHDPENNSRRSGYLLKKRTYNRRRRIK